MASTKNNAKENNTKEKAEKIFDFFSDIIDEHTSIDKPEARLSFMLDMADCALLNAFVQVYCLNENTIPESDRARAVQELKQKVIARMDALEKHMKKQAAEL